MLNTQDLSRLKGFRFLQSLTGYAVWAYHRFALNLRYIKDVLAERRVTVSCKAIRDYMSRYGYQFTAKICRGRSSPTDKWHLDEVAIQINGRNHWLWRASDAKGDVLETLMQSRRNKAKAHHFLQKLVKRWGQSRVLVTDKLRSYGATKAQIALGIEHLQHKGFNNRSEVPHRHTQRREKIIGRFKSSHQTQQFLSVHDQVANLFCPKRHRLPATSYRHARNDAFAM